MSIIEALILGLVQGLTEFIPVSSSGHLVLLHDIFNTQDSSLGFDVALHIGTLFSLLVYFYKDILGLIRNVLEKNEKGRQARLVGIATVPAALSGLLFSSQVDSYARSSLVVATALGVVGLLMLFVDMYAKQTQDSVQTKKGMYIGLAQALALIPGVSRSGATITAGLWLGLERKTAARFSFLLAIPIIAGSALGLLIKGDFGGDGHLLPAIVGATTAFFSGLLAISFMLSIIDKVGLRPFAVYRILLSLFVLVFLL